MPFLPTTTTTTLRSNWPLIEDEKLSLGHLLHATLPPVVSQQTHSWNPDRFSLKHKTQKQRTHRPNTQKPSSSSPRSSASSSSLSLSRSLSPLLLDIGIHSCFFLIILCSSLVRHSDRLLLKWSRFLSVSIRFRFRNILVVCGSHGDQLFYLRLPLPVASLFLSLPSSASAFAFAFGFFFFFFFFFRIFFFLLNSCLGGV